MSQMLKSFLGQLPSSQRSSRFYDFTYQLFGRNLRQHYTRSRYYFLWTVIVDRLRQAQVKSVLEVGCGTGQLACLLHDNLALDRYVGFDFSRQRVDQARRACPEFEFELTDVFETDLFYSLDYDAVIATEFLEHISEDHWILNRIKPGKHFLGTVPDFPSLAHVRYFRDADEVHERYQSLFQPLEVVPFLALAGKTYFLIQGTKLAAP